MRVPSRTARTQLISWLAAVAAGAAAAAVVQARPPVAATEAAAVAVCRACGPGQLGEALCRGALAVVVEAAVWLPCHVCVVLS